MAPCIDSTLNWTASCTLQEALLYFGGNKPAEIPAIVRFFENPDSPYALPGKTSLHNHDCIHILLDLGMESDDEAFVLGFTMGNDRHTQTYHVSLFKFASRFLYPPDYRLTQKQLQIFEQGFHYGKSLKTQNLNLFDFALFYSGQVQKIRDFLGIDMAKVQHYRYSQT